MNDRLSRLVAGWLSHPTGFLQAVISTTGFFVPVVFGWPVMVALFWFLAWATFVSYATQFTLAYQNKKSERTQELLLRNLNDTMRLLVALAERQTQQLDRIEADVEDHLGGDDELRQEIP